MEVKLGDTLLGRLGAVSPRPPTRRVNLDPDAGIHDRTSRGRTQQRLVRRQCRRRRADDAWSVSLYDDTGRRHVSGIRVAAAMIGREGGAVVVAGGAQSRVSRLIVRDHVCLIVADRKLDLGGVVL